MSRWRCCWAKVCRTSLRAIGVGPRRCVVRSRPGGCRSSAPIRIVYSPVLTGVITPVGVDADAVRQLIHQRFDLSLGTGLGRVKGRMFRIGHLGDSNDLTLLATLAGVEMGLKLAGIAIERQRRATPQWTIFLPIRRPDRTPPPPERPSSITNPQETRHDDPSTHPARRRVGGDPRNPGAGPDRTEAWPCRRPGLAVRVVGQRICAPRQRKARQQGQGGRVRLEPARWRFRPDAEAAPGHHRDWRSRRR